MPANPAQTQVRLGFEATAGVEVSLHGKWLVDAWPVRVASLQHICGVKFEQYVFFVIDVADDRAIDILLNTPPQAVITKLGKSAAGEIDAHQTLFRVIAVSRERPTARTADLSCFGFEVAVGVLRCLAWAWPK